MEKYHLNKEKMVKGILHPQNSAPGSTPCLCSGRSLQSLLATRQWRGQPSVFHWTFGGGHRKECQSGCSVVNLQPWGGIFCWR